ncbi:MAG TPA: hypothetical protein ENL06_02790 [Candidatus Portnoybacteria bacterium]|nr:hypothetical protein [Candidatus Portnoybacteria bacterium]
MNNIFNPKAIALVGATNRKGSVGLGLANNLLLGKNKRQIFWVNPNRKTLFGKHVYSSILDIHENLDLVVIAIPAKFVISVVRECIEKKVGGIIVISAGFAETGSRFGQDEQKKLVKLTQEAGIPLIGPNCLGIIDTYSELNASFSPITPSKGNISFISQSGALIDSVLDMVDENYGFRRIISVGNESMLEITDFLEYLKNDPETKVIILYLEGVKNGRKLFKLAKTITKTKPIIVLKAGRTKSGGEAVKSHTASLAGDDVVFQTACRQSGMVLVEILEEVIALSKLFSWQPKIKNGRIGIITNGGGVGVLTADYCEKLGIPLAKLSSVTVKRMINSGKMNLAFSKRNPLDLVGDALADRYQVAIESWLSQSNVDGLIIILTPQIMTQPRKTAEIIIQAKKRFSQKIIITVFSGGKCTRSAVSLLEKNKIPNFIDSYWAVWGMKQLIKRR